MRVILTKYISFMLIVAVISCTGCSGANGQTKNTPASAANFTLQAVDGEEIVLANILKEKKAVLIFWATWCYFCRRELPRADEFYWENRDKVEVIGIDVGESKAKVESFIKRMEISYNTLLDLDSQVAELYKVRGVPTIVAVDQDNQIMYYGHSIEEMASLVEF